MAVFHLTSGDPLSLTLAADARLSHPDFSNDQIWELRLEGSEPPALVLQTTYGLRAHWMRVFPHFIRKDKTYSDPARFQTPPQVDCIYPNYIHLVCSPFAGFEVQVEYWAASSQVVACRMQMKNTTVLKETIRLEWAAVLSPLEEGSGMTPVTQAGACHLTGQTANLVPVLVLEGCSAAGSGSYPALSMEMEFYPGSSQSTTWACAALDTEQNSLEAAQKTLRIPWEAQAARIALHNSSQMIEIQSGKSDWDAAFRLAQTTAAGLIMPEDGRLPHSTFVLTRHPDLGYSLRGNGSDYTYLWKGQTGLDTLYLASLVLPARSDLVKGWIENFLSTQDERGRIDWRPNLIGQRNRHNAQPVLATLAYQVSDYLLDPAGWLASIYPALVKYLQAWFQPDMDRDADGFPEWEDPQQTGLEDLPLYNTWNTVAQGLEVSMIEAPALGAFLYRECQSLLEIGKIIAQNDEQAWLEERSGKLKAALDASWDAKTGLYRYRDYQSHQCQEDGEIKHWHGSGKHSLRRTFKSPQRLQLRVTPGKARTMTVTVRIAGFSAEGETSEEFGPRRWTWAMGKGRVTSQLLFKGLIQVEIQGAEPDDVISIHRVDHHQVDISVFTPLWARASSAAQAKKLIGTGGAHLFGRRYGAPLVDRKERQVNLPSLNGVSPLWVQLVGEGMIAAGHRKEAVDLVTRTMDAITGSLKRFGSFREYYDADNGQPMGERNHLRGLAPLGLFLKCLGLEKLTENEIILRDFNPFPTPVTVQYRGMNITFLFAETVVGFPNGQIVHIKEPGLHRVSLE